jgi:hypothetical protein
MILTELNKSVIAIYEMGCPYNGINTCMASLSSMLLNDEKRADCCGTENYDDCPIFLSKILRVNSKGYSLLQGSVVNL